MTKKAPRIVVIGGGAAGMSTAVHAAEAGADVTVVERHHPGAGSTGLSAGVFTTTYSDPTDVALRVEGAKYLDGLAKHGLAVIKTGFLRLGHTASEVQMFERSVAEQHRQGVRDAEVLDPAGVARKFPDLRTDDIVGALWAPSDSYIDGNVLCGVWAERLADHGGRVVRGTVDGFSPGPPHEVKLGSETIPADVVVNAAGAWAPKVGRVLGHEVRLVNERHAVVFAHLTRELAYTMPFVMDYAQGSGRLGVYFRAEGHGQLLAGLHSNDIGFDVIEDPDHFSTVSDAAFMEEMAEKLLERLPGLADDLGLREGYAGLYPYSPDGRPIVGPTADDPSVVLATGGGGVGVNLSPAMGRIAAEWALEGASSSDFADSLLPNRFEVSNA